jgi:hypothetical protein
MQENGKNTQFLSIASSCYNGVMKTVIKSEKQTESLSDFVVKGGYYIAPTTAAVPVKNSGKWGTAVPSSHYVARSVSKKNQNVNQTMKSAPKSSK